MKYAFEILNITRNNILNAIKDLSLEQLTVIPTGFKNNIIWNAAHVVVTQQLLCYKFSGLEMYLDYDFIDKYKKGSVGSSELTQEELDFIIEQLMLLPTKLESDYSNTIFSNYNSYTTSYNITLSSIEDAIQFNNVHDGLHFGYIMAMKKVILK
tara:strand:- start:1647 stop:2108 length:462 start_codon:yes stop_codon:yes gene_type:complete